MTVWKRFRIQQLLKASFNGALLNIDTVSFCGKEEAGYRYLTQSKVDSIFYPPTCKTTSLTFWLSILPWTSEYLWELLYLRVAIDPTCINIGWLERTEPIQYTLNGAVRMDTPFVFPLIESAMYCSKEIIWKKCVWRPLNQFSLETGHRIKIDRNRSWVQVFS